MNKKLYRLGVAFSSAALIASSFLTPALALNVEISGNGASSENEVEVKTESEVKVEQDNDADIDNNIDIDADTGGNSASWNTGGDVKIDTGDATSDVKVTNVANANTAEVSSCCPGDLSVTIKDNGAYSENEVEYKSEQEVEVDQDNDADIDNDVDVDADTGDNKANSNTNGSVEIKTGSVDSSVTVDNTVNLNSARLTGSNGGATLSVEIAGNGASSENEVEIKLEHEVEVDQDNDADIDNDVDVDAETGDNKASWNTGGEVVIDTGDVVSKVDLSTLANFNSADVDSCGCIFDEDSWVKIKDNGAFSENEFELETETEVKAEQDNDADIDNDADVDGDTGDNKVKGTTVGDDPTIETGASNSDVTVENEVNSNVLNGGDLNLPELPGLGESAYTLFALFLAMFS